MFICVADGSNLEWRIIDPDTDNVLFTSNDEENFMFVNLTRTGASVTSTLTINNASEFRNLNIECIPDSGQTSTFTLKLLSKKNILITF